MAKQKKNSKDSPVKKDNNPSKTDEAISHILEVLESIEDRLTSLESQEAADYDDDFDALDSRLFKVEGRMGL